MVDFPDGRPAWMINYQAGFTDLGLHRVSQDTSPIKRDYDERSRQEVVVEECP